MVDEHPRFHLDALRWFASLTALARVEPSDLVVNLVGPDSSDAMDYLKDQGVEVHSIERFDPRSPHCNKISGALRLADRQIDGTAVLCDTDVVVLEDPRRLRLDPRSIAGKLVDAPVPSFDALLKIFATAGLPPPPRVALPWGRGEWTVPGNNNGGVYLVPGPILLRVATAWSQWALWLLDRTELLEEWTIYVDQVAMALALAAEGIGSTPLDVKWNTPTHDPTRIPPEAPQPAVIHYHQEVNRQGLIRLTGAAAIDERIDAVNRVIERVWRQARPSTTYQRWLSVTEPNPVPEVDAGEIRKALIALLAMVEPASVLEVGLDTGISHGLPIKGYVGIDTSADAVSHATTERADERSVVGMLARHGGETELTLCFTHLLDPLDAREYTNLATQLWKSSSRALMVSGYEDARGIRDPSFRFHEPLSVTLRRVGPDAEIYPVLAHGAVSTFIVLKRPVENHPRDYGSATLTPLVGRHPDPLSLIAVRLHARHTTHFYPDHAPRLWEYPVVAQLIAENLDVGSRLVDVGAGVTPLPPFLMSRGYIVDTVDPSPTVRDWPPKTDWNEWGFLDYRSAGLANHSWNCTLDDIPVVQLYDGIYSISVIEHIPAADRRLLLAAISARTRRGGLVVLTIDLVRGSEALWNRNLGIDVEDPVAHGTMQDVIEEGAAVGLELFRKEIVEEWGETQVDIGLLAMRRTDYVPPSPGHNLGRRLRARLHRPLIRSHRPQSDG